MEIQELDALALKHIARSLLDEEPALMSTKWFDYRHLHPVQATALFMGHYSREFAQAMAYREDYIEGLKHNGLKPGSLIDQCKQTLTGLWSARQVCDRSGWPYDWFCYEVMHMACVNGWDYLPRPCQMYTEELMNRLTLRWASHVKNTLVIAQHPRYRASVFEADFDQQAYQEFLIHQVCQRTWPEYATHTLLRKGHLVEQVAVQQLGGDIVRKANELCLLE